MREVVVLGRRGPAEAAFTPTELLGLAALADRGEIDLSAGLVPIVSLDGTVNEIIGRIVRTYVAWVSEHPALHAYAIQDSSGPFEQGIDRIATTVAEVLALAIDMLGVELGEAERSTVDPLAFGLVGAVFGTVRRWVSRTPRQPGADRLAALLAGSAWHLLDGHARRLGLDIDPDLPVAELLPAAAGEPAG